MKLKEQDLNSNQKSPQTHTALLSKISTFMVFSCFLDFFSIFFFMREVSHVWKMPEVLRRKIKCPPQQHKQLFIEYVLLVPLYLPDVGAQKRQGNRPPPKIYIYIYLCFIDYAKAFNCVDLSKLWKILKEMEIPDHLTCLLRNLYAGQEETVRTRHEIMDLFQIGKGLHQACIPSPCLFNFFAEHIM